MSERGVLRRCSVDVTKHDGAVETGHVVDHRLKQLPIDELEPNRTFTFLKHMVDAILVD